MCNNNKMKLERGLLIVSGQLLTAAAAGKRSKWQTSACTLSKREESRPVFKATEQVKMRWWCWCGQCCCCCYHD